MKVLLAAILVALTLAAPAEAGGGSNVRAYYLNVRPGREAVVNGAAPGFYFAEVYVNNHYVRDQTISPLGHVGEFYLLGSVVRLWLRDNLIRVSAATTDPGGVRVRVRLVPQGQFKVPKPKPAPSPFTT